ncbi:MAG: PEGA domain-containing protein [Gemmatimonadetes bacterium]|nr:PEGA domain-containing protein [Gemmatimonadota bacterium]
MRYLATVGLLLLAGCATIMHGTSQGLGLSSSPTDAKVTVDNKPLGNTPVVATLSRKDTHIIRFEMAGFLPYEATVTRKVSGWVWGNIIFGGLIGLAVDAITGGLYELSPEQVTATLGKQTGANVTPAKPGSLNIFVVLAPDASWHKVGQLSRQ